MKWNKRKSHFSSYKKEDRGFNKSLIDDVKQQLFVFNRGDTFLHHGGLHTNLNQCN